MQLCCINTFTTPSTPLHIIIILGPAFQWYQKFLIFSISSIPKILFWPPPEKITTWMSEYQDCCCLCCQCLLIFLESCGMSPAEFLTSSFKNHSSQDSKKHSNPFGSSGTPICVEPLPQNNPKELLSKKSFHLAFHRPSSPNYLAR